MILVQYKTDKLMGGYKPNAAGGRKTDLAASAKIYWLFVQRLVVISHPGAFMQNPTNNVIAKRQQT